MDLLFNNVLAEFFHLGAAIRLMKMIHFLNSKVISSKENLDFYIGVKIHNKEIYNEIIRQWQLYYRLNPSINKNILLRYRAIK